MNRRGSENSGAQPNKQDAKQDTQLVELFDRAAELARAFPNDNVLTYAAKIVGSASIEPQHWPICQALLLRAALSEPSLVRRLPTSSKRTNPQVQIRKPLPRQSNNSVSITLGSSKATKLCGAMSFSRSVKLPLTDGAAAAVGSVDDDLVALTALHLNSEGLIPKLKID